MGLYLYCIGSEPPSPPAGLRGVDGEAVRSLEVGGFRVWTSESSRRPEPSLERIRRHDRVVRAAALGAETPLPVRFGQWFPGPDALASRLHRRADDYRRALRVVAGSAEVAVQVLERRGRPAAAPAAATPHAPAEEAEAAVEEARRAGSGRGYLEALARREGAEREARHRGEEVAGRLAEHLGGLVRGQRTAAGRGPVLVRVAQLVAREDLAAHRHAVRRFAQDLPDLRVRASGPWPPYSFVE